MIVSSIEVDAATRTRRDRATRAPRRARAPMATLSLRLWAQPHVEAKLGRCVLLDRSPGVVVAVDESGIVAVVLEAGTATETNGAPRASAPRRPFTRRRRRRRAVADADADAHRRRRSCVARSGSSGARAAHARRPQIRGRRHPRVLRAARARAERQGLPLDPREAIPARRPLPLRAFAECGRRWRDAHQRRAPNRAGAGAAAHARRPRLLAARCEWAGERRHVVEAEPARGGLHGHRLQGVPQAIRARALLRRALAL